MTVTKPMFNDPRTVTGVNVAFDTERHLYFAPGGTMAGSALDIISKEQIAALREAGFIVVHQQPTEAMMEAGLSASGRVYGSLEQAYHRMVGESIRSQNNWRRAIRPIGG